MEKVPWFLRYLGISTADSGTPSQKVHPYRQWAGSGRGGVAPILSSPARAGSTTVEIQGDTTFLSRIAVPGSRRRRVLLAPGRAGFFFEGNERPLKVDSGIFAVI